MIPDMITCRCAYDRWPWRSCRRLSFSPWRERLAANMGASIYGGRGPSWRRFFSLCDHGGNLAPRCRDCQVHRVEGISTAGDGLAALADESHLRGGTGSLRSCGSACRAGR